VAVVPAGAALRAVARVAAAADRDGVAGRRVVVVAVQAAAVAAAAARAEAEAVQIDPAATVQEARTVDRAVQAVRIGLRAMVALRPERRTEIAATGQLTTMALREPVVIDQATPVQERL